MAKHSWLVSFDQVGQVTNQTNPEAGAFLAWARWAADGLCYLEELDERAHGTSKDQMGFHPDTIDMSHGRWAATSAITSLDLCAVYLGIVYCGVQSSDQWSLRYLDASIPRTKAKAMQRMSLLPSAAKSWVTATLNSPSYSLLLTARNPFVHSRLNRTLQASVSPAAAHQHRTLLPIGPKDSLGNSKLVDARNLVVEAKTFSIQRVEAMLLDVVAGRY